MKRQHGFVFFIGLSAALGLCLAPGTASADNIAWDMVSSTSQNLVSYTTDAPVFSSPGDGFQKYAAVQQSCPPPPDPNLNDIPYALVDDSVCIYEPDVLGMINSMVDFNEFFGVVDTENNDNSGPVHATWVFDMSAAVDTIELRLDLAAMGDFEATDSYEWTYQIDGGPVTTALTAVADEAGSMSYTMASGTVVDLDDPLVVNGTTLTNGFQTFSIPITAGSQLTVVLTASTDGGSEGYAVRNIMVTDSAQPTAPPQPIPTLSRAGIAAMVLLLMAGGVFLVRRLH